MSKAPAVDYALEIIEMFARKNCELGIADISNSLGINKNAVSRILEALLEKNWIYISDSSQKKYSLTLRPFSLLSFYNNSNNIVKIATPYIQQLNKKFGDSVYLGVKNNRNVIYLVHFDSTKEVRINGRLGGEYPLNSAAPGKILLSYSKTQEIRNYFDVPLSEKTEKTITDFDTFMSEAEKIREQGFSVDNEEFAKGVICIAVPVFDFSGNVVAAIGLSSLTLYDDVESLIKEKLPLLLSASDEISLSLGYRGKE